MATMSRDTQERLEDLVKAFEKTGKKEYLEEIKQIFENHRDNPTVLSLKKTLKI